MGNGLGRLWRRWVWMSTQPTIELQVHRIESPYDELEMSRRYPWRELSLPARLLLCEGYRRAQEIGFLYDANPQYDMHEDAHQTAQALACGEFE